MFDIMYSYELRDFKIDNFDYLLINDEDSVHVILIISSFSFTNKILFSYLMVSNTYVNHLTVCLHKLYLI